jgi:hypothetical protein
MLTLTHILVHMTFVKSTMCVLVTSQKIPMDTKDASAARVAQIVAVEGSVDEAATATSLMDNSTLNMLILMARHNSRLMALECDQIILHIALLLSRSRMASHSQVIVDEVVYHRDLSPSQMAIRCSQDTR